MNLKFRLEGFSVLSGFSTPAQKKVFVVVNSAPSRSSTQTE
jgi:hypothetical protein